MKFWKVSAIGNDFVLVHGDSTDGVDWSELSRRVCHRRFGVGSDGLLVLRGRELRMFNPDGSEDFCGNGLRCAAVHAWHQGWIEKSDSMTHFGRLVRVWIEDDETACVEIPAASFRPADVPTTREGEIWQESYTVGAYDVVLSSLSTGSTHTVIFCSEPPDDKQFFEVSQALEHHEMFPERTSTMWVTKHGERQLHMRPFERGAGETRGCGTGSAAAAVAYSRLTGLTGQIGVENTGGTVRVHLEDWHGPIRLESKTVTLFEGVLEADLVPMFQADR